MPDLLAMSKAVREAGSKTCEKTLLDLLGTLRMIICSESLVRKAFGCVPVDRGTGF